jgi:hypothetical protein
MDRTKLIGIVTAAVGVIVVLVALKWVGGEDDGGADEATPDAEASGGGAHEAAGGGADIARGGGVEAAQEAAEVVEVADQGSGFVPSGGARGVEGDIADFGGDLTILPPRYTADPLPALDERVREAAASALDGRTITIHSFGCLTGGADCRVSGTAQVPTDVRRMAEQIEQGTTDGDEEAPTVEIDHTRGSSSGSTDFVLGVYY